MVSEKFHNFKNLKDGQRQTPAQSSLQYLQSSLMWRGWRVPVAFYSGSKMVLIMSCFNG
ncbi:hypothetical protein SAMN05661044_05470 [Olivibacter domesticus]|uniref:Uncharacterized protein n=1 Tax=Olivibacter domesticus TaxID=407022 RepID=A0A1H7Z968_OLID1|nr:hypothetical protein SAMN05661044_05470 [Olivibacter domesticus]